MNHARPGPSPALTRRIRDLLRTEVLSGAFPDGRLPSEEELRTEFGASRAVVRSALDQLQREGLVTRRRGVGTVVTHTRTTASLAELHGVVDPEPSGIWSGVMRTQIIEWADTPAGEALARRFDVAIGTPLLRIDYIALLGDIRLGTACNYMRYPHAHRVTRQMIGVDWYRMLSIAGIGVGSSTFLFEASVADAHDAELIDVEVGAPVLLAEQLIRDPDGTIFDIAFIRNSADHVEYRSTWRSEAEAAEISAQRRPPAP
ncbi:GntR family transcriptional regulator [Gordonia sp. CPCC 206044]|uniref:GntR family transcriptional regulator n=1 Tax=Gordonia sp. CPCC 206044 TaxID=3140793 RepID=UPI003AF3C4DA